MTQNDTGQSLPGFLASLGAFFLWGGLTVYWKWLAHVEMFTVLAQRILWVLAFTALILALRGRLREIAGVLTDRRSTLCVCTSGLMIAANWFLFYWGVNSDRVIEASLGYYMAPLLTILLGRVVLKERLTRVQGAAVALLCLAIGNSLLTLDSPPLLSLTIAGTFSLYGLARRSVKAKPLPSMFVETAILAPLAVAYLVFRKATGYAIFGDGEMLTVLLLMGSGIATGLPVLLFAFGAPRVRMTTLGIIQYLDPTVVFLLGAVVYGEPLESGSILTFALIWAGIALYMFEGLRLGRKSRHPAA